MLLETTLYEPTQLRVTIITLQNHLWVDYLENDLRQTLTRWMLNTSPKRAQKRQRAVQIYWKLCQNARRMCYISPMPDVSTNIC